MSISRRRFLSAVGSAGGYGALYTTMMGMGLLAAPRAYAGAPKLGLAGGKGASVAILGAGIAGLVAAYELRKAGYNIVDKWVEANGKRFMAYRMVKAAK